MQLCYAIETDICAGPSQLSQRQLIDNVAAEAGLLDRVEELLIFASAHGRDAALRRLESLGIQCEPL
jgi:hypothetical protein